MVASARVTRSVQREFNVDECPLPSQRSCSPDAEGKITTAPVVVQVDAVTHDGLNLKGHTAKALESFQPAVAEHCQRPPTAHRASLRNGTTPMPARKNRRLRLCLKWSKVALGVLFRYPQNTLGCVKEFGVHHGRQKSHRF